MNRIISDIGVFSALIPMITLLLVYKKAHHKYWWALFCIAFIWVTAELLNWTLSKLHMNNIIIFHLFEILSILAYAYLFCQLIKNKFFRRLLIASVILIDLSIVYYLTINQMWFDVVMPITMICALVPLVLSIVYFFHLMFNSDKIKLLRYPFYWINSAILISFGMAFFTYIFIEKIIVNPELTMYLWPIISISNFIYNILFSKGVWLMKKASY